MSSHREAPEISKDPVADNADVYAFVSPDDPHGHDRHQLRAAPGPGRGPELLRVRRRRPLLDLHRQRRRRACRRSSTSSSSPRPLQNPNTFLYNTGPIGSLDRPELERPAAYSVARFDAGRPRRPARTASRRPRRHARPGVPKGRPARGLGANLAVPAVQHRPALDAELRGASAAAAVQTLATRREGVLPASGTTRSSSTSARSSTSAACGRSTPAPDPAAAVARGRRRRRR